MANTENDVHALSAVDEPLKSEVLSNEDELRLAALGKKQAMKRNFNIWSLLFMCFCTSVTWEALSSVMAQALNSGGSSSMVWGFVAASTGALLISLCFAEFSSIIPTAGGQYHYVAELSPPRFRRIFSWFAGWTTIWGWTLATMSGFFANAMQIQAWAILFYPEYVYERWHTSLIIIALTSYFTLFSIFGIKWLHYTQFLGILLHLAGFLVTIIYLLAKVQPKNSASFVFTDLTNLSGWSSDGVAWSIGLLAPALGLTGWDSSTHLAEEMKDASRDLPRTMYGCVAVTAIVTWPWVIALMFCITDINSVLAGPAGLISPLTQLVYDVSGGSQGTTVGITMFYLIMVCTTSGANYMTATSRVYWSFARDGGLPKFLAKVDDRREVPVNALICTWFWVSALSLIYIGNSTAFYGLASGATSVMVVSYAMPIVLNLIGRLKFNGLKPGHFTLGRFGLPINIAALCWCIYLTIFLSFPTTLPVTAITMNYSSVVLVFGFVLAGIAWVLYGHKTYLGIVHEVDAALEQIAADMIHQKAD